MSTGKVVKVDVTNRKFSLHENVEILRSTGRQYQVRNEKGIIGWVNKDCIAVDGGTSGKTGTAGPSLRQKPPIPKVKPWQAKPPNLSSNLKAKPATHPQMSTLTASEKLRVPPCFKKDKCSGIYNLNWNRMSRLLPSYGITDPNDIAKLTIWWKKNLDSSPFTLNHIPPVLQTALGSRSMRGEQAKVFVAKANTKAAPDLPSNRSGGGVTDLSRAGSRTYHQLGTAYGFHGWGGSMSVEHARMWADEYWSKMSQTEKDGWYQDWKGHTRDRSDEMPFVATGWVSQKAGHSHRITVPLDIPQDGKHAVLLHNHNDVMQSTLFCIAGRDEVLFLTGIPMKYIHKS